MAGVNRTTGKATDLITFSRASGGTALRKISYGSELAPSLSTAIKVGDAATTIAYNSGAGSLDIDAATTLDGAILLVSGVVVGRVYLFTADITLGTCTDSRITVGPSYTNQARLQSSGTVSLVFTAEDTQIRIDSYTDTGTFTINSISVKEVLFDQPDGTLTLFNHPTNIPRIEYAADGTVKGLLIEEARTNLLTYSEDFTTVWNVSGGSVLSNQTTAPDGANTADLIPSGTTLYKGFYTTSGVTFTHSIYVKAYGSNATIRLQTGTGFSVRGTTTLNLETLTVTEGSGVVDGVGNGWYRFSTQVEYSGAGDNNIYLQPSNGVYLWGMQVEQGSFPTSYIPTAGATATRAADIASISVDNFGYNQTNTVGTFFANFNSFGGAVGVANRAIVAARGTDRAVDINVNPSVPRVDVYSNHTAGDLYALNGPSATDNKVAAAMAQNNSAACANGNLVKVDTSTGVPVIATDIHIGRYLGVSYLNGHIKSVTYYPRRLSNAQLQELTA